MKYSTQGGVSWLTHHSALFRAIYIIYINHSTLSLCAVFFIHTGGGALTAWLIFLDLNEQEVWNDNDEDDYLASDETPPSIENHSQDYDKRMQSMVKWLIGFFLLLQAQFSISQRIIDLIFRFLKVYFTVLGRLYTPCANLASQLPMTSFMAHKMFTKKWQWNFRLMLYVKFVELCAKLMNALKTLQQTKELSYAFIGYLIAEVLM